MKKIIFIILALFSGSVWAVGYDTTVGAAVAIVGTVAIGATALFGTVPALATLAIGTAIIGLTIPNATTSTAPIVVQVNPNAKFETPSGWTAPTGSATQPTPPATISAPPSLYSVDGTTDPSLSQACSKSATAQGLEYFMANSGLNSCYMRPPGSQTWTLHPATYSSGCPDGYTLSGSSCNLSNPTLVMKPVDGVCGIIRSGNSFSSDSQDSDCSTLPATTGLSVSSTTITAHAPDGTNTTIVSNADGTITVTNAMPSTAGGTPTTTTTTTSLSAPDSTGTVKVQGQNVATTNGSGTGSTSTSVQTVKLDTSGLATESTQTGIHTDTTAIKGFLDAAGIDSSLSSSQSGFDTAMDSGLSAINGVNTNASDTGGVTNPFTNIFSSTVCGCEPLTLTYHNFTKTWDWCPYVDSFKSGLQWVLSILAGFTIFSMLIKK